ATHTTSWKLSAQLSRISQALNHDSVPRRKDRLRRRATTSVPQSSEVCHCSPTRERRLGKATTEPRGRMVHALAHSLGQSRISKRQKARVSKSSSTDTISERKRPR